MSNMEMNGWCDILYRCFFFLVKYIIYICYPLTLFSFLPFSELAFIHYDSGYFARFSGHISASISELREARTS